MWALELQKSPYFRTGCNFECIPQTPYTDQSAESDRVMESSVLSIICIQTIAYHWARQWAAPRESGKKIRIKWLNRDISSWISWGRQHSLSLGTWLNTNKREISNRQKSSTGPGFATIYVANVVFNHTLLGMQGKYDPYASGKKQSQ